MLARFRGNFRLGEKAPPTARKLPRTYAPESRRKIVELCQYTSIAFGKRCDEAGVKPSLGSVGDCFDNAMGETVPPYCGEADEFDSGG